MRRGGRVARGWATGGPLVGRWPVGGPIALAGTQTLVREAKLGSRREVGRQAVIPWP